MKVSFPRLDKPDRSIPWGLILCGGLHSVTWNFSLMFFPPSVSEAGQTPGGSLSDSLRAARRLLALCKAAAILMVRFSPCVYFPS